MKIKNKNFEKYKNQKIYLFQIKIGTRNKKPQKSGKIRKIKKILTKNLSFFERFSLTHSGGSSVPPGTIINSSRTNPRFGPSFK